MINIILLPIKRFLYKRKIIKQNKDFQLLLENDYNIEEEINYKIIEQNIAKNFGNFINYKDIQILKKIDYFLDRKQGVKGVYLLERLFLLNKIKIVFKRFKNIKKIEFSNTHNKYIFYTRIHINKNIYFNFDFFLDTNVIDSIIEKHYKTKISEILKEMFK